MRGEVGRALLARETLATPIGETSSDFRKFGDSVIEYGVTAQRGCLLVLVISRRGFLVMHIWEYPTLEWGMWVPGPGFKKHAIEAIRVSLGDNSYHKAGILNLRDQNPDLFQELEDRK
jgi:hypothetical protein